MPAALPTPPSIPPTDAPMLYTGADPAEAQRLMEAMWGRAASISDAVLAAYSAAQAQGEAVPTSTEGQAISSEHDFVDAAGGLARGLYDFDLRMGEGRGLAEELRGGAGSLGAGVMVLGLDSWGEGS